MSKLEKYTSYKDSNIQWLGYIPNHWNILKSKYFHKNLKSLNTKRICDNVLSLTLRGVVNNNIDSPEGLVPRDYATYQIFDKNDLVFKLIDLENISTSRVGLVHEKGIMSSAYIRIKVSSNSIPKFAYYYYYSLYINQVYNNIGSGVRSTLGPTDLLEIEYIEPPIKEQEQIISYLDNKTSEIDNAISQKEQLIELLKEQKQVVVNEAVTKGLSKNIEFIDSGVEWIENIPKNWSISKLGTSLKPISIKNRPDLPLLSVTREQGVILRDIEDKDSNHNFIPDDLSGYKMVEKGQFAMNKMKAWQGSYGISDYTGIVSPAYYIFELKGVEPSFFHIAIRSKVYVPFFTQASDGVRIGQWDLSKSRMKEIPFYIPPTKEEQLQIVEYIKKQTTKIDKAIELQQNYIAKLKEYKASLIDSVVTGKVRVA